MSYGSCNFPQPRVDVLRAVLLYGVVLASLSAVALVAVCDFKGTPKTEHVAQGPRNLPDGNTHLAVEKCTSL